ncbi:threonine/homoserine/homoserine lactone efflux protein [Crossiella equi]|uniref:Threonine/homoserine/homoserine lactone efflux protein n=1 Tax=Crossiella equi TaxID=130796 RepID=A0ABS5AGL4_9PSEU|nr:LysE family translocator [Crossiella equi]MBP2475713.1 threonine/homoserine/homoserine lactone efflux protein [Crossiella equi]
MDLVTWPFVLTCVAVVVSPGPSLAVIVNQALRAGRTTGLATIAGNTSGLVFWAAASALGLTALVRTSEVAFVVLKVAGAAYLCWLGIHTLIRSRRHRREAADLVTAGDRPKGLWSAYRAGLLANLSNPKAAALYLALLPQFLPPDGSVLSGTAVLTVVQMAISAGWYVLVVLAVSTVRRVLSRPAVRERLDQLSGLVLVGMGIRMATLTRAAL